MKRVVTIQVILVAVTILLFLVVSFRRPPLSPKVTALNPQGSLAIPDKVSSDTRSPLLNPSILADLGKHYIINFRPLRDTIIDIQSKYKQKTYIYFLYLNNGAWIGINEKDLFTAASTLKVPLAMSLMNAVEDNKLKLTDSFSLEKLNLDSNFGDLYKVGADKGFTIEELLKIMLEQSDNTAMNALFEIFTRIGIDDPLSGVYDVLGWEFTQDVPVMGEPIDYSQINLKTLANMFLALYNAKYLNIPASEKILGYLANTPFSDKMVAGVPENTVVSHKIGTAAPDDTYSDCGIVYAPNRHYLLCIGSYGADEKIAARFMAEISRAIYTYVIND